MLPVESWAAMGLKPVECLLVVACGVWAAVEFVENSRRSCTGRSSHVPERINSSSWFLVGVIDSDRRGWRGVTDPSLVVTLALD